MMDLITKIEMKNYNNHLQEKMKEDKLKIRNSNKVVISADKTGNFYMVDPKEYQKFLTETVTKDYKKVGGVEVDKINKEAATIAKKLKLDERIDAMGLNNGYLTLKDHKPNFPNRLDLSTPANPR